MGRRAVQNHQAGGLNAAPNGGQELNLETGRSPRPTGRPRQRRNPIAAKITHVEFQQQVVDLATMYSWRHLHVRRSIGRGNRWTTTTNITGWPDLLLFRPDIGYVPAELKIPPDTATPEQAELLAYFATMPATFPKLWTPNDWPDIEATLAVKKPRRLRSI